MSNIKSDIKVYSAFYNELTVLRGLINAIPYAGSQIDLLLSIPGQKFVEERLEYLINELQGEMTDMKEKVIELDEFNKEETFDLVNKAFHIAAKTRQKQKLKLIAKIIRGGITIKSKKYNAELFLSIIDDLTEREIEIAFLLYQIKTDKIREIESKEEKESLGNDAYWISVHYPNFSKEELEYTFPRLEKTGLIKELVGTYMGYIGGTYNITSLFHDFITFIKQNE